MEKYSEYTIKEPKDSPIKLIVLDQETKGVTLSVRDDFSDAMISFNLPRAPMIDALEYVLKKLKAK